MASLGYSVVADEKARSAMSVLTSIGQWSATTRLIACAMVLPCCWGNRGLDPAVDSCLRVIMPQPHPLASHCQCPRSIPRYLGACPGTKRSRNAQLLRKRPSGHLLTVFGLMLAFQSASGLLVAPHRIYALGFSTVATILGIVTADVGLGERPLASLRTRIGSLRAMRSTREGHQSEQAS